MKSLSAAYRSMKTTEEGEFARQSLSPWYAPESHFEELPGILCATDLLAAWQPETAAPLHGSENPWNVYFNGNDSAVSLGSAELSGPAQPSPVEKWDGAAAASAVDCLYRFLRALEGMDVEQAMLCVGDDYHELDRDTELDRNALRLRLERWVDEWRGPELRISLTEIPEPVFHPAGVLIHITLQVDFRDKFQDRLATVVQGYVVRFDAELRQQWLIRSLCRIS